MGVQTRFGRLCVIVSASMLAMAVAPPPGQADDGGRDDASRAHVTEEKSVRVTKSGVVVQTVRVGDSTVTTYGPDAPPVSVTLHGRTASASISVEPSRRSQRPFDPTVFEMTLASGHFSRQEACAFAKAIDPRGCVTAATLRDRRASDRRSAQVAAATEFLDSRCWTFTHEPGWLHGTRRHSSTSGRNGPDRVLLTRTDGVPSPPHWFASTGPAPDRIFWRRG
jgi:hypothetical protein